MIEWTQDTTGGDLIVENVIDKYIKRSPEGIEKYGTTLQDNDSDLKYWLEHLQEELMDASLYIEKILNGLPDPKGEDSDEQGC